MATKERLTEDIKYLTELLKLLWLTIIALTGSVAGLVLAEIGLRRMAMSIGAITVIVMIATASFIHRRIRARTRQLQEV